MVNPLLPFKKANTIILDGRADKEIINNLKKHKLDIILTPECKEVQKPISYHPDIHLHPINYKKIVVAPNVFEYYNKIFKKTDIKLIKGESELGYNYPYDIAYNMARIGNFAIHNLKYTDEKLKYHLLKEGIEMIDVNQGYSKCSIGIIGKNTVVTSDEIIHGKLIKKNIKVLLIENGYIELEGYNYGFIGGSMGNIDEDNVLLAGEFKTHIDGNKIKKYLKENKKRIIELKKGEIKDLGSLIPLII